MPSVAAKPRPRRTLYAVSGIPMPREADGRTILSRRYKQLVQAYSAELGSALTEADKGLIASVAAIAVRIEKLRAEIILRARCQRRCDHPPSRPP
jgi:hypothetical protein